MTYGENVIPEPNPLYIHMPMEDVVISSCYDKKWLRTALERITDHWKWAFHYCQSRMDAAWKQEIDEWFNISTAYPKWDRDNKKNEIKNYAFLIVKHQQ